MTEQKKGTLSLSRPGSVKTSVDGGDTKVRQSFSHGKSKVVVVEVKKKRTQAITSKPNSESRHGTAAYGTSDIGDERGTKNNLLTTQEMETRIKVIQDAIREEKEQVERLRKEMEKREHLKQKETEERAREREEGVPETRNVTEVSEKTLNHGDSEKGTTTTTGAPGFSRSHYSSHKSSREDTDFDDDDAAFSKSPTTKKVVPVKKDIKELKNKYASGSERVSIYNALDEVGERSRSLTSIKRAKQKNKLSTTGAEVSKIIKDVILPETISVQELASRMAVRVGEVVKTLMKLGVMVTANHVIDSDTAEIVVMEFGHKASKVSEGDVEIGLKKEDHEHELQIRPPIVTIMGHVDHGKTSLLDALRKTDVAIHETGGITQGIGAYQVTMKDGRKITFIDTPGHAAFTEMRSRGANVTDIVVLVVAADDSVKDQTIEAINHAKAAGVCVVVAINKIDKSDANPDNVRKALLSHDIVVESFGGEIIDVEISAKTGLNLEKLEESILLQAEMLDLKANPNRSAEGIIVESKIEKGYGPVATVLIEKGTLKIGDIFVSGSVFGRVRAIKNDRMEDLFQLTPGMPGEIAGFSGSTIPGSDFVVVENEARAREIAGYRDRKKRELSWVVSSHTTFSQMFSKFEADEKCSVLSVIVKADVEGSSEAICSSLKQLSTDEVAVKVLHAGIGEISESDVVLAKASNAIIIGFNVRSNIQARDQIFRDKIKVKYYSIIYDLTNDIKSILSGLLVPDIEENILGSAEIRKVFNASKIGKIAGCMVREGTIKRGAKARLVRDGVVVYTGEIKSVRRQKDDVKEVKEGFECGLSLENYQDIHEGDVVECFELKEVARQL
ncbi:MAG: translation initiation factor IF-2 [Holosporaceae bacterium]|nr:translation initiation factor IF-2 [Holosporaceae bacterium]